MTPPDCGQGIRWSVPATAAAVAFTRRRVVAQLLFWGFGLTEETAATLELLVTELVANAIQHGEVTSGTVEVGVAARPGRVLVVASDSSRVVPRARGAGGTEESGRGMQLIEALADDWGCELRATGKDVWLVLSLPEEAAPAPTGPSAAAGAPDNAGHRAVSARLPRPVPVAAPLSHAGLRAS
ncbi:ATP-binding protein [Streptacidiphilus sp. P02-A3a]|uniref:ATP-binding protein n=1 Tax=Streptacidiphilus sp. P02-A3a TaxID=2704468 RepID=UPI0015F8AB99|nr:ATP-binding protein [Streptacidiphilus sp. P02-A3a]QMU70249.1 ATP-binding protein [Streptacidiphilus sp. P02-A3a]QMU70295.1 ATP-binding protein [Streptacidiphilus sp. P02-A3a]